MFADDDLCGQAADALLARAPEEQKGLAELVRQLGCSCQMYSVLRAERLGRTWKFDETFLAIVARLQTCRSCCTVHPDESVPKVLPFEQACAAQTADGADGLPLYGAAWPA